MAIFFLFLMFFAMYCLHLIKIGSAVWWFNTKSDSVPDPETKHAACPVLLGQKWSKFNVCDYFFFPINIL